MTKCNSIAANNPKQVKKNRSKLTRSEFISRAKLTHGDKFEYKDVFFDGALSKVKITCRECETVFYPTVSAHMRGGNCPTCSRKNKVYYTNDDFINKASKKHDGFYSYEKSNYIDRDTKVKITCPIHGLFSQRPSYHLKGRGCHKCGINKAKTASVKGGGWTRSKFIELCKNNDATLYVLKCFNDSELFYKVGITSATVQKRYRKDSYLPYDYEVLFEIKNEAAYIFNLEYRLHDLLKNIKHEPSIYFRGRTECFTTIKPIEKLLKELSSTEQIQLIA